MNGFRRLTILFTLVFLMASCATRAPEEDINTQATEDLSALDKEPSDDLEADLKQAEEKPEDSLGQEENKDEFAEFNEQKKEEEPPPPAPPVEPPPAPDFTAQAEPAPVEEAPKPEPPAEATAPTSNLVTLKSIQFKSNDNGGTVVIDADGPMTYSTRLNASSGQFVIDIPNTILPKKLTRPLITKDFEGTIGSIDAYQSPGSNVSRVVVHLRPGSAEPVVQTEGNSLLVVSSEAPKESLGQEQVKLLSYDSLEEFLSGNMQFSGKKISIETDDMELKDIFKLISEEGGVNLVITDEVRGKMSVKLRQVPWDQALVMLMRAKKLSYTKTGNVLRIAPIEDIRAEEDETVKLANAKKITAPLRVKLVPVSYAKVEELEKQVKPFLSTRGTVMGDTRTSSLVISDIDEHMERVLKLIQSIDIPPQQVLIEGKVVEASDNFEKQIGIQWQATGKPVTIGSLRSTTSLNITPGSVSGATGFLNFNLGTLDILGDLSATLTLKESEGLVKVLSSPRVVTLHNETAEISQTQELPIITSTVSPTGAVSPTVTFKPVKLKLGVTPQITNNGGVIMGVDVTREFAGQVADTATQARPINSRTAKTKVLVQNGQTAVIGGVYQSDISEGESRVPWLGNMPVIGWLFKTKTKTQQKNELLIFLTPRIIGQLDSQTVPSGDNSEGGGLQ
jgi:type IV pilus assembly protein PilQ